MREHHPSIPILIAGNGDRVLTVAAQHADIIGLTGSDIGEGAADPLAERVDFVRKAAGHRFCALTLDICHHRRAVRPLWNAGSIDDPAFRASPH